MVLDMQARLLLDMLGKGIEPALVKPSPLVVEPWLASGETLNSLDPESMAIDPALVLNIQFCTQLLNDFVMFFQSNNKQCAGPINVSGKNMALEGW